MAKIRVYELARDLNMANKALLDKIREMNINVTTHTSSLEEEMVEHIKAELLGKKKEVVDVVRVQPTVIRRRPKRVEPVEEPPAPEDTSTTDQKLEADDTDLVSESPVETQPDQPATDETATAEASSPAQPDQQAATTAAPPETSAATESAAVPDAAIPVDETKTDSIAIDTDALETATSAPEPSPSPPTSMAPETAPETTDTTEAATEDQAVTSAEPTSPAEPTEVATTEKAGVTPTKPEPPAVDFRLKKKKKGTPARIVRLPDPKPEPVPPPPVQEAPPAKVAEAQKPKAKGKKVTFDPKKESTEPAVVVPLPEKEGRKGKKKTKPEEVETETAAQADKTLFKKKPAPKRKEIVEGKTLYEDIRIRPRRKKGGVVKVQKGQKTQITIPKAIKRRVRIDEIIQVANLAKQMGVKAGEIIQKLMAMGVMATVNQTIDFDTASLLAVDFGFEIEKTAFEEETVMQAGADDPETMSMRPPVITIMGHVDHGKTSLLDVIRQTSVTETEAGGITQHIGAYMVSTDSGNLVFLDTPGHEAFTAMRARGAKVTDLVVLVVAADDGVMPQTVEALNHAKAAHVPMIVAVNKIDKANADPDRVKRELADHGVVPEDWGGDTIFVHVSAKAKTGINELLEMILLQSEVLELKANPHKLARGHVIEAKLDTGRGPLATVLIKEGTLHTGDSVVCGIHYGKVRAMLDDQGHQISAAGPSQPVAILGLTGVPVSGDEMVALKDEKDAKQVSAHRTQKLRTESLAKPARLSLEGLYEQLQDGMVQDLNLILRGDVQGSIEALKDSLLKLSSSEVRINVIHAATGTVTESDVALAAVSNAIIIGFNVRPSAKIQDMAEEEHIDMRFYDVIFNIIKDIKNAIIGLMKSEFVERFLGRASVREVFHIPKIGAVAGSYVTDGKLERNQKARLIREGIVVYDGRLSSLRRFKDDAKEVMAGYECGIGIENFNDIKIGDEIECYYLEEIKPSFIE